MNKPITTGQPKAYSYIRFSKKRQRHGDSLRRQTSLVSSFVHRHNLDLQDLTYEDLGVSAFRGSNHSEGALGQFVEAVRNGDIEAGSWLLVESVDRLSRQETLDAFALFSTLIKHGVIVATLQDEQVYTRESLGGGQIYVLIGKIQQAHEESDKKQFRSKANWDAKREKMRSGKKFKVATVPQWLAWDETQENYRVRPEAANTLQRLFRMSLDGFGAHGIARQFNDESIPMLDGRPSKWLASTVNRLQNDRKLIGEYQPKRRGGAGERIPLGESVEGFYPQVISKDDFYEAKRIRDSKRKGESGSYRRGNMRNLFTGLLRCGHCGQSLHVVQNSNKVRLAKYGAERRLVCNEKRALGCASSSVKYPVFERMVCSALAYIPEIMAGQLSKQNEIRELDKKLGAVEGELKDLDARAAKVLDLLLTREDNVTLTQKFDELEKQKADLSQRLVELQVRRQDATSVEGFFNDARRMFEEVNSEEAESSLEWRQKFNVQLKRILSKLVVYMSKEGLAVWAVDKADNTVLSLVGGRRMRLMSGESDMKGNHYGRLTGSDSSRDTDKDGELVYFRNRKEDSNIECITNSERLDYLEELCIEYFDWFEFESFKQVYKQERDTPPTVAEYFEWHTSNLGRWGETAETIQQWEQDMTKALAYCGVAWLK